MKTITCRDKRLNSALCQFVFPYSIKEDADVDFKKQLLRDGYIPFHLNNLDQETAYYGEGYKVSHPSMERYYLPFTNEVLFPRRDNPDSFLRFSKAWKLECILHVYDVKIPFRVHSVDLILCPFNLGFMTIRTELMNDQLTLSKALEFADRFRVLQDIKIRDESTFLEVDGKVYEETEQFIFQMLVHSVRPYLDQSTMKGAYFETLPFFVDERMYVQATYQLAEGEESEPCDLYRAVNLNGLTERKLPKINAGNQAYVEHYLEPITYTRWAPHTYFVTNEHSFCCVTSETEEAAVELANHMYGQYYYGLLLNLFHKIALLKLSNRYSSVQMEQDNQEIEDLIRDITKFSSKYFFRELVSQSQGKEIFIQLRTVFGNSELFQDVKQTLSDLHRYKQNFSSRRRNYLLMILTIYTVISGIYGMNQVIDDLGKPINWEAMTDYSLFEYIALFVIMSGIAVAFTLAGNVLYKFAREKIREYKYDRAWKRRAQSDPEFGFYEEGDD
ncbi:hypothetical protein J31TS4_42000 [Paenibacillus sp. J31TS4]|uniref:hypothetical protein n=1 Tax=Paenibacillus sp. J31TS4 TaxID=2807195 RepID=UPI001B1CCFFC|nr:hypothetical protein [Paenibacillus sp. J31TS4]GIP40920.1 hypothetical protein J31TS4_42000 [Paenibacillus sp. J31TS4]